MALARGHWVVPEACSTQHNHRTAQGQTTAKFCCSLSVARCLLLLPPAQSCKAVDSVHLNSILVSSCVAAGVRLFLPASLIGPVAALILAYTRSLTPATILNISRPSPPRPHHHTTPQQTHNVERRPRLLHGRRPGRGKTRNPSFPPEA